MDQLFDLFPCQSLAELKLLDHLPPEHFFMSSQQLAPAFAGLVIVQVAEAKELEGEGYLEVLEVVFLKFNRF